MEAELSFWIVGAFLALLMTAVVIMVRKLFGPTEYEKQVERQKGQSKKYRNVKKTWQEVVKESTFLRGLVALFVGYLIICLFYPELFAVAFSSSRESITAPLLRGRCFFPIGLIILILLILLGLWMFLDTKPK